MVRKVGWFLLFLLGAISLLFLVALGVLLLPSSLLDRIASGVPTEDARRIVAVVLVTAVTMILAAWAAPRGGMSRWWTLGMLLPVLNVLGIVLLSWRLARHTVDGPSAPAAASEAPRHVAASTPPGSSKLGWLLAAVLVVALLGLSSAAGVLAYWTVSARATSSGASEVFVPSTSSQGGSPAPGRAALPYKAYGDGLRAGQVVEIRRGDAMLQKVSADAQGRWSVDLQPNLFTNGETLSLWLDGVDTRQRFVPQGGQFPAAPGFVLARATSISPPAAARTADDLPPGCGVSDVPYKAYGVGIGAKQRVEAFFNGTRVGQTTVDDAGNWSFNIDPKPPLVAGARVTFTLDGAEIAGVSIRFCSAQFPRAPGISLGAR